MKHSLIIGCIVVIAVLGGVAMTGAATTDDVEEDSYVVELEDDGSATVSLVLVYDLQTDEEQQAFEDLEQDEDAATALQERYVDRMETLAATTAESVDRDMAVSAGSIEFHESDNIGLVVQSVEWSNLAAAGDDQLVLSAPFDTGIEDDGQALVVVGPDGFELESATPEPTETDGLELRWDADTNLEGFEVVYNGEVADDDGMPALGPIGVLVGIGTGVALAARWRITSRF